MQRLHLPVKRCQTKRSRRLAATRLYLEPLEARLAPAFLFNYSDVDGDLVSVRFSKGALADATFTKVSAGSLGGFQLQEINLNGKPVFNGANITVTARPQRLSDGQVHGDGVANIGFIDASGGSGINLGAVSIPGDLGEILAGSNSNTSLSTAGLQSLSVLSLGRFGTSTGAANLQVGVRGKLGALNVQGDVTGALIGSDSMGPVAIGGSLIDDPSLGQSIGSNFGGLITIGGDLSGSVAAKGNLPGVTIGGSVSSTSVISSQGDIGVVKVAGDLSGPINAPNGKLAVLRVGGSVNQPVVSGIDRNVSIEADIGSVSIGRDLNGSIESTNGNIGDVTVAGSLLGGIQSHGNLGLVTIGGSVNGPFGALGAILAGGKISGVTIGGSVYGGYLGGVIQSGGDLGFVQMAGSLIGGDQDFSGQISSGGNIGFVDIGGDVVVSAAPVFTQDSAKIVCQGALGSLMIGGSLIGGTSAENFDHDGQVFAGKGMGPVRIRGDVIGGAGFESAQIRSGGKIASVTIGGSLVGYGFGSGSIFSQGGMGPVTIGGDVRGGEVDASGKLASIRVGGSVVGDPAGFANNTGEIISAGNLGPVTIGRDLRGGSIDKNSLGSLDSTGYIEGARIASVFIGGSIVAGTNTSNGFTLTKNASIRAAQDIGPITVRGSIVGQAATPVIISALGQAKPVAPADMAIAGLTVGGRVQYTQILAGYDTALDQVSADAQVGAITVAGDWIASDVLAGTQITFLVFPFFFFAKIIDPHDNPAIQSTIAAVTIGGQVIGDMNLTNRLSGFAAEFIKALKVGGTTIALRPGPHNDSLNLGDTGNAALVEV
jgi:hypothetical protein